MQVKLSTGRESDLQLRIDWDEVSATYTQYYRYADTDPWLNIGTTSGANVFVTETSLKFQMTRPVLLFGVRAYRASTSTVYADFTDFHFEAGGMAGRAFSMNYPVHNPPTPTQTLFVPLPRYNLFSLAVQAVSNSGELSPEAQLRTVVTLGPPPSTINNSTVPQADSSGMLPGRVDLYRLTAGTVYCMSDCVAMSSCCVQAPTGQLLSVCDGQLCAQISL